MWKHAFQIAFVTKYSLTNIDLLLFGSKIFFVKRAPYMCIYYYHYMNPIQFQFVLCCLPVKEETVYNPSHFRWWTSVILCHMCGHVAVHLTIEHRFRYWFGAAQATSYYLKKWLSGLLADIWANGLQGVYMLNDHQTHQITIEALRNSPRIVDILKWYFIGSVFILNLC